ncbi:MAG TPA: NAD-dependent protein deacetylase 1, partial [Ornithinibacter sp.]|nr:NAD-dependent protein deacetylase 1 [Ornithinibacter sp.]
MPDAAALAALLTSHPGTLVLTGAGMSTDSGIPDYRGPDG